MDASTKTFTLTAYFTGGCLIRTAVLLEERCGSEVRYFWEHNNGRKEPCSPRFVKALQHTWTRHEI